MAIKPILFNTDMVQAILEGRKTQTRRAVRFFECDVYDMACAAGIWNEVFDPENPPKALIEWFVRNKARKPFRTGDILWVRETWCQCATIDSFFDSINRYAYKADYEDDALPPCKWKPSIHMPKDAARIFLIVKNVRAKRLQDMNLEDFKAEGIWDDYKASSEKHHENLQRAAYPVVFKELWNSTINKADLPTCGWDANPWVWVIEFERTQKPEGWC